MNQVSKSSTMPENMVSFFNHLLKTFYNVHTYIHSRFIHNGSKMETSQITINRRMDTWLGILHKSVEFYTIMLKMKNKLTAACNSMDRTHRHHIEQKKLNTKEFICVYVQEQSKTNVLWWPLEWRLLR